MRWVALLAAMVFAAACAGGDDERLTVFAASSLTEVFEELAPDERFSFAGSDELAEQIRRGATPDVYASADPRYALELFEEGLVERPRILAANQVVLVVPRSNPAGIRSLADLRRPGIRLVIGARGVPIGNYTRAVLSSPDLRPALANVVSEEQDVKSVAAKVASAEADAGFVYTTDVRAADGRLRAIYPAVANPVYAIAVVAASRQRDDAEDFVEQAVGPEGEEYFLRAGFVTTNRRGEPLP